MKRRNSIITLLLTLSMVFSTSAFAVFADTTTDQENAQVDNAVPAAAEFVVETPEVPAATQEQAAEDQEQGAEAVELAGEATPAEDSAKVSYGYDQQYTIDGEIYDATKDYPNGKNWSYVAATKTLTLNNYSPTADYDTIGFSGTDLNIVLIGNNTVNGISGSGDKLVLSGSGSLTVNNAGWLGIFAKNVEIKGGNITIKDASFGILAVTSFDMSGGCLKVSGWTGIGSKRVSFRGDIYADIEANVGQTEYDYPAVTSFDTRAITFSDGAQIILPENGKIVPYSYDEEERKVENGAMIADASGKMAKHVIIDRVMNPSGVLIAKAVAKGKTNMELSWTAMNDVDGYDVFFARCNTKSKKYAPELVASVNKGTTSYTVSGLKKDTAYKAYVQAYIMKRGAKQYVGKSFSAHAYAGGSSKKYTNPKSVKVKKAKVSIKKGKTYKINASVRKLKKGKKLISAEHAKKLRYLSSNTSIATVSKKGKIKAVTPGTCTVYAIAANGVYKTVSVTVK